MCQYEFVKAQRKRHTRRPNSELFLVCLLSIFKNTIQIDSVICLHQIVLLSSLHQDFGLSFLRRQLIPFFSFFSFHYIINLKFLQYFPQFLQSNELSNDQGHSEVIYLKSRQGPTRISMYRNNISFLRSLATDASSPIDAPGPGEACLFLVRGYELIISIS